MKTEDELDAEVAKLFDEVKTAKVEMVNGKLRILDQATLDQMEREEDAPRMEEACCTEKEKEATGAVASK